MSSHSIPDLPSNEDLDEMSSQDLSDLSAQYTNIKDIFHGEYKSKQDKIHEKILKKQKEEQQERINNDPEYWNKHQGVGQIRK